MMNKYHLDSTRFTKFGNVILSWKMKTSVAFAGMVQSFVKPPATIIDLCAGEKRMYRSFNGGNTLKGKYTFIFGDIRDIKGNDYTCDIRNAPKELYNTADAFVFDPPWHSTSGSLNKLVKKYYPMKKKEFIEFLPKALNSVKHILKPAGILIIKIAHPWNHEIYSLLKQDFTWKRDIVQVSIVQGIFLVTYFMIFQKKENKNEKQVYKKQRKKTGITQQQHAQDTA